MCCLRINEMSAGSREQISLGVCAVVTEGKVSMPLIITQLRDEEEPQRTMT